MKNLATVPSFQKTVVCPVCKGNSIYSPGNPNRPFCSPRCKSIDFGAWANEDFRMATDIPPDDAAYGDPKIQ